MRTEFEPKLAAATPVEAEGASETIVKSQRDAFESLAFCFDNAGFASPSRWLYTAITLALHRHHAGFTTPPSGFISPLGRLYGVTVPALRRHQASITIFSHS